MLTLRYTALCCVLNSEHERVMAGVKRQLHEAKEKEDEELGKRDYEIKMLKDDLATAKLAAQVCTGMCKSKRRVLLAPTL